LVGKKVAKWVAEEITVVILAVVMTEVETAEVAVETVVAAETIVAARAVAVAVDVAKVL
jgi:hypothetical protein